MFPDIYSKSAFRYFPISLFINLLLLSIKSNTCKIKIAHISMKKCSMYNSIPVNVFPFLIEPNIFLKKNKTKLFKHTYVIEFLPIFIIGFITPPNFFTKLRKIYAYHYRQNGIKPEPWQFSVTSCPHIYVTIIKDKNTAKEC